MFLPIRHKSLFHDVQQEMLAIIKRRAYWSYVGLRASGLIAKGGMFLAFGVLLGYIIIAGVMQQTMTAGPDETKKLAEAVTPYIIGLMGTGIVAGFFYEHLWSQLQPVVREAARGIQD
ncbi:hypothetical protein LGM58_37500 [Burkholderia contaminans]|uniref:hypothetical protein n=1 Tax=Burkholderia TaxID=32008 RepID=UPI0006186685|nr:MULTISPECIES: hypothetical protein [Burkholderia]MBW5286531.1 hypothetical protein [Burkholderia gladioli]MCA7888879.1 hypothetical protein [Burkholderia contaminans]